jgi:hypothetical protein
VAGCGKISGNLASKDGVAPDGSIFMRKKI